MHYCKGLRIPFNFEETKKMFARIVYVKNGRKIQWKTLLIFLNFKMRK